MSSSKQTPPHTTNETMKHCDTAHKPQQVDHSQVAASVYNDNYSASVSARDESLQLFTLPAHYRPFSLNDESRTRRSANVSTTLKEWLWSREMKTGDCSIEQLA